MTHISAPNTQTFLSKTPKPPYPAKTILPSPAHVLAQNIPINTATIEHRSSQKDGRPSGYPTWYYADFAHNATPSATCPMAPTKGLLRPPHPPTPPPMPNASVQVTLGVRRSGGGTNKLWATTTQNSCRPVGQANSDLATQNFP